MRVILSLVSIAAVSVAGCIPAFPTAQERNAFLSYTEAFGASIFDEGEDGGGGGGDGDADAAFRLPTTLTVNNNHSEADLEVALVAWVNTSSIRSADQQDDLFNSGYNQLTSTATLGTVFSLPPGTFVLDGPGIVGARDISLGPGESTSLTFSTPDAILLFEQPPVSCESVAFRFTIDGANLQSVPVGGGGQVTYEGATGEAGLKTLAQVDVYQCNPLRPGLFLRQGGGGLQTNEFFEGSTIVFDFNEEPDDAGNFAIVTKTAP